MAKLNVQNIRLRPNTAEENYTILQEIKIKKEVDARKQNELNILFDCINAECASRSLKERRKALLSLDKQEKTIEAVHYGPIQGFPSGTWWGIRMDCSRDYVHEPFNEDVHDGPFGAVSICTSHLNTHNDVDLGDVLTFTTEKHSITDQSKNSLILSYKNRVPIRLVRSYCLSNSFAPKTGYRYDGLYTVVDYWIGISSDTIKLHKFVLVRVLDQEYPSWIEKITSKVIKKKKSISPRLTRSNFNINSQEPKPTKFVCNTIQKKSKVAGVSAIVSRQVFKKFIPDYPDNSTKSTSSTDLTSQSSCLNICPSKLCSTNLSIRTNLYDSSHKLQEVKKNTSMTFCRILKSNQSSQLLKNNSQSENKKKSVQTSNSDIIKQMNLNDNSIAHIYAEKKIKKVTWADSCNSTSSSKKTLPTTGNGFKYSGSGVIDGFSPTTSKKCVINYHNITENLPSMRKSKSNNILASNKKNHHIVQVHSRSNVSQTSKNTFTAVCESFHDNERFNNSSSSIDSLAPDKLVNVIVKEKYHPMAKLLIGNMIGLENQESSILSAYKTLTSKVDQDDSITCKKNKIRNKFYIRNKSRKNGVTKKQRREIMNLIIDAKFDPITRGSRSRRLRSLKKRISKSGVSQKKLINAQRIPSQNTIEKKEIQNTIRELQPKKAENKKIEKTIFTKNPKMVTAWTQCTLLTVPSVDQSLQIGDSYIETILSESDIKVELVNLDDIKSEPYDAQTSCEGIASQSVMSNTEKSYFNASAFAAVNTTNSNFHINRLRSIGFRPIESSCLGDNWNQDFTRTDGNEEYNKYTNEENNVVGYMNEQLHFEDIEEEESMNITEHQLILHKKINKHSKIESSSCNVKTLSEYDYNKPWHGWKKISTNGQIYWTGY